MRLSVSLFCGMVLFAIPTSSLRADEPTKTDKELTSGDPEVDRILEKIHQEGESSLTDKERRTLKDASRRYQRKRR